MANSKLEHLVKEKKQKKEYIGPAQVKVKKSIDIDKFPHAIVDGKFIAVKDQWLIYERKRSGKPTLHFGRFLGIDKDGNVNIWDETLQQCFGFNINETVPLIRIFER